MLTQHGQLRLHESRGKAWLSSRVSNTTCSTILHLSMSIAAQQSAIAFRVSPIMMCNPLDPKGTLGGRRPTARLLDMKAPKQIGRDVFHRYTVRLI